MGLAGWLSLGVLYSAECIQSDRGEGRVSSPEPGLGCLKQQELEGICPYGHCLGAWLGLPHSLAGRMAGHLGW